MRWLRVSGKLKRAPIKVERVAGGNMKSLSRLVKSMGSAFLDGVHHSKILASSAYGGILSFRVIPEGGVLGKVEF